jgi:hypothetical protein
MTWTPVRALLLVLMTVGAARAQTPTGTIAGVVTDPSGAALAEARVSMVHRDTGQTRTLITSREGYYSAAALPPGMYDVSVEARGFKRLERVASVEAGTTTAVDLALEVGKVTETVTVSGVQPLIRYDHHQVGGVVTREQIETLPLNGRTFLELAKLEPGITNPARLGDGRVFVSPLGAGLQTIPRIGTTRVTVDGASITTPGTVGVLLQISQDIVQEFQTSTVTFDLASSLTSNGAINIVTRSGGNGFHGNAFYFYRDHHLAAYPALGRDPSNPDPFFQRRQFGSYVSGPIRKDRAFFLVSYERNDQRGVVSIQPSTDFAHLGGIFPSPYDGNQFNARLDVRLRRNHNAFVRYTHDGNSTFGGGPPVLQSGWFRRTNMVDQGLAALTSVLSTRLVNDLRLSYFSTNTPIHPASFEDCPDCFGLGAPRITIQGEIAFGTSVRTSALGRRFQLTDSLVWEKGNHRLRFGFDWEHAGGVVSNVPPEPAQITLWSPTQVRRLDPTIPLPASFTTVEDILQLPLRSFETRVGPSTLLWRGFRDHRGIDLYRLFASDTWRAGSRLTLNYGLGWSYEPNVLNDDLTKPALLTPILGADGLKPPDGQRHNFSPTLGFAWTVSRDAKTVVRGGAGRYFDAVGTTNTVNLSTERHYLSPLGTGRLTRSGSNILYDGRPLDFPRPTSFTGAQLLSILPDIRAELLRSIDPDNRDLSVRNIDLTKEGENLYDPSYATPYAVHLSMGIQRELARGFVLSADFVWKHFVHTFINGIDYNLWNSLRGPVIPKCIDDEQQNDVGAVCSNGNIFFDTTIGRARYKGLLVRVEKRLSGGTQFLGSYALGSFAGTNGTGTGTSEAPGMRVFGFNNDDWFENYGPLPTDQRHVLNLSGFVELPWRIQAAFSVSAYSRPPFTVHVANIDFNGDGTLNDLLPGTRVNQFGRGLDRNDLARLVDEYNHEYAGRPFGVGNVLAPQLTLPDHYSFDDNFFTQDVRVFRTFVLGPEGTRLSVFGEVFNLFNTANLVGYSGNIANRPTFGQPNARFTQVFGSGGPRAFQLGGRVSF